jgi:hypothetical protein
MQSVGFSERHAYVDKEFPADVALLPEQAPRRRLDSVSGDFSGCREGKDLRCSGLFYCSAQWTLTCLKAAAGSSSTIERNEKLSFPGITENTCGPVS